LHGPRRSERLDAENKSAGGIVIPDTAARSPIKASRRGRQRQNPRGRQGAPARRQSRRRILFGKYSGQAVKVEGTEYLVMREDDIMGVVAK